MAIFKCKMCGGELNLTEDSSICECEYCGTTQTVPSADNEKKMNLFSRANRLLFMNDFDKASGVYESIVAEFPEEAEAYWGLVLCKYGIEYVDDPATGKKVPTCHRSSFDSIMVDSNFQMVMEYADSVARSIYRSEAKQIEEIRKGIIEVSGKEEPYDIFICYKETDDKGDRTIDSLIAQDTYDALTEKGYRVFFSRITLEDKLGQEYEPYIFAALNSAKVMLAFGTDYEHYNAVWVKNEWSRYLQLIAKGEKKTLIPCYKDIDAYDIPMEFAKLQAQDMGKVGAMQDLLRGIEKIIPLTKVETIQAAQPIGGAPVASLLERIEMFLEEKNWKSADEYIEKVLDNEPKNAKAYLYKACSKCKSKAVNELVNSVKEFEELDAFQKAVRFADDDLKAKLEKMVVEAKRIREEKYVSSKAIVGPIQEILKDKDCPVALIWGKYSEIVGLKVDGTVVARDVSFGNHIKKFDKCSNVVGVGSNGDGVLCINADGTIFGYDHGGTNSWQDIVSVTYIKETFSDIPALIIGLKFDGTVVVEETKSTYINKKYAAVSRWQDIMAIKGGREFIVGLKSDGTVVAAGENERGQCNVEEWQDIVSIDCGYYHTVGLKADRTVVATGSNARGQCDVTGWTDIVSIACNDAYTIGLKADGTIMVAGRDRYNSHEIIKDRKDVVSISCSNECIAVLKSDGTVAATGHSNIEIEEWNDIVYLAIQGFNLAGIKADGTVVFYSHLSRVKTLDWKLFDDLDDLKEATEKNKQNKAKLAKLCDERKIQRRKELEEKQRLEAEAKRKEAARKAAAEKLRAERRSQGVCQYCGGELKGLISKKCVVCSKPKDY